MGKKTNDKEFEAWAKRWNLDEEEREMLRSAEAGEWKPLAGKELESMKRYLKSAAEYTLGKSKSISIRLTPADLDLVKARAVEEGMPYHTLIASLIHKYAHNQ